MLALLGDSHTRSYPNSTYVATRIFLSQGQKNNFTSLPRFWFTTLRYLKAAYRLKRGGLAIGFIVGEPDMRWVTYGKWHIGSSEEILRSRQSLRFNERTVDRVALRLAKFLTITNIFGLRPAVIIGCGSPNPEMVAACLYCNQQFEAVCMRAGCLFFDPQKVVVAEDGGIKPEFIGFSVFDQEQRDHTHLSTEISLEFNRFLSESWKTAPPGNEDWKKRSNFSRYFVEVRDFDTYRPVDSPATRLARLARRIFSALTRRLGFG